MSGTTKSSAKLLALGLMATALGGCGSMKLNVWPFGEGTTVERPRGPENATEYRCEGGKGFYVRYLDGGAAAWVIYPDRQVRLDKVAGSAVGRYSNGIAVLQLDGDKASLTDGPAINYTACKAPAAASAQ
jgi:membrane-bound inhibitor of C-type lysozyme